MDGTVQDAGGQYELRFERHLKHPVEKVWAALTDPEHRDRWLAFSPAEPDSSDRAAPRTPGEGDRPGPIASQPNGFPRPATQSRREEAVRTAVAPRLLEYSRVTDAGHEEPIRWELFPEADGTRLVLTHTVRRPIPRGFGLDVQNSVQTSRLASSLATWHGQLEGLALFLDGQPAGYSLVVWADRYLRYLNACDARLVLAR